MMRRSFVALALAGALAGCGNPVHSHYSVSATAPCLSKLGYRVNTNAEKLGLIESSGEMETGSTVITSTARMASS